MGRATICHCLLALAGTLAAPTSAAAGPSRLEVQASGVFLNPAGHVLTAHHAVAGCGRIHVVKDGRVASAQVVAEDAVRDLAVLATTLAPLLPATFPSEPDDDRTPRPVFAEGYGALQAMPDRSRTLSNAITVPGTARLAMLSHARPGASGSAVIGADGRMLGMIVARSSMRYGARDVSALSRRGSAGAVQSGTLEVHAVPADAIRQFLHRHGIAFAQSRFAQLGAGQASAARAATLSVGVLCN